MAGARAAYKDPSLRGTGGHTRRSFRLVTFSYDRFYITVIDSQCNVIAACRLECEALEDETSPDFKYR